MDTTTPQARSAASACPRCGKALVDAAGLGWCSACGYCRTLEAANAEVPQEPSRTAGRLQATGSAVTQLPLWFWIFLLVVGQGIFLSVVADRDLPAGDSLNRALWTTMQAAIGLVLLFFAQFWILLQIAPEHPTLTFKDAIVPFRLWSLAIKQLPRQQGALWVGSLGLTLMLGAVLCIGGLQHWFQYIPGSKSAPGASAPAKAAPVVIEEQ